MILASARTQKGKWLSVFNIGGKSCTLAILIIKLYIYRKFPAMYCLMQSVFTLELHLSQNCEAWEKMATVLFSTGQFMDYNPIQGATLKVRLWQILNDIAKVHDFPILLHDFPPILKISHLPFWVLAEARITKTLIVYLAWWSTINLGTSTVEVYPI